MNLWVFVVSTVNGVRTASYRKILVGKRWIVDGSRLR